MDTMAIFMILVFLLSKEMLEGSSGINTCVGRTINMVFQDQPENISVVKWIKVSGNGEGIIATVNEKNIFDVAKGYTERITLLENGNIRMSNIQQSDEGIYVRQVTNGVLKNHSIELHVLDAPSDTPKIDQTTLADGTKLLECEGPKYTGKPAVSIAMQDSNGVLQDNLKVFIKDNAYSCCMYGPATTCLKNKTEACVKYTLLAESLYNTGIIACISISYIVWAGSSIFVMSYYLWWNKHALTNHEQRHKAACRVCVVIFGSLLLGTIGIFPDCVSSNDGKASTSSSFIILTPILVFIFDYVLRTEDRLTKTKRKEGADREFPVHQKTPSKEASAKEEEAKLNPSKTGLKIHEKVYNFTDTEYKDVIKDDLRKKSDSPID